MTEKQARKEKPYQWLFQLPAPPLVLSTSGPSIRFTVVGVLAFSPPPLLLSASCREASLEFNPTSLVYSRFDQHKQDSPTWSSLPIQIPIVLCSWPVGPVVLCSWPVGPVAGPIVLGGLGQSPVGLVKPALVGSRQLSGSPGWARTRKAVLTGWANFFP